MSTEEMKGKKLKRSDSLDKKSRKKSLQRTQKNILSLTRAAKKAANSGNQSPGLTSVDFGSVNSESMTVEQAEE